MKGTAGEVAAAERVIHTTKFMRLEPVECRFEIV
jgi:hypothetical protein